MFAGGRSPPRSCGRFASSSRSSRSATKSSCYACGPSLEHFHVDPERLAFDGVVVCEYLTFMEVMQQADVQLYA